MHPIICQIGPFTVYAYGFMLVVAFFISSTLASQIARKQKINADIIFNLAFVIFISGIVGARVFYIIQNLSFYLKNPIEIIMLAHGGLSWFGGLILSIICAVAYLKTRRLSIYKIFDLIAPFVALGQALGRIGCLLNGCCFGRITKFGIYFPLHRLILIPTQLYASLALILVFIILRFLQERPHPEGQIFFTYLLLYSLKRFIIEFWRMDNTVIFLGLTLFQLISLTIFCFSFLKLFLIKQIKI